MNNVSFNLNSLTKEEVTTILESLLFSSSVDVCASWYKEDSLNMFNLAKKIRNYYPEVLIDNVYIIEDKQNNFEPNDKHTKKIVKIFPEIKKEKIENL
jgi:hypothetical protein